MYTENRSSVRNRGRRTHRVYVPTCLHGPLTVRVLGSNLVLITLDHLFIGGWGTRRYLGETPHKTGERVFRGVLTRIDGSHHSRSGDGSKEGKGRGEGVRGRVWGTLGK